MEKTKLSGIFYGVGVGPGDPELLTVKAINAIKNSDVIIAPKTEKKEGSLALSIVKPHLNSDAEIIYQTFPMIKKSRKKFLKVMYKRFANLSAQAKM